MAKSRTVRRPTKKRITRRTSSPSPQKKRIAKTPRKEALMASLKKLWDNLDHKSPTTAFTRTPGIYTNLTFDEYAAIPAINFSSLKNLDISPAHYRHAYQRPESDSLRFGNYVHTAVLEPERLLERYLVMPDFTLQLGNDPKTNAPYKSPKSTKAYKLLVEQFHAAHPDKIIVSLDEFNQLLRINKGIYSNPEAAEILSTSINELTIIWEDPETSLLCKGRIDALNHDYAIIGDLKTTGDISRFELDRYCYHQQQAFYQYGYSILTSQTYTPYIFAVEKEEPHSCRCAPIDPSSLSLGLEEIKRKLALIRHCKEQKHWPGPSNPEHWTLSKFYQPYSGTF